jgi:hypothetical protein
VDLDPEQRDEGLVAGPGQVLPAIRAARAEHPVLVDPDKGADLGALNALEPCEGPLEIGWAEALLSKQGPPASGLSGG